MSIQKKNGRWYAAVYLGTKDKKQEYEWSEGFGKKDDAKLAELEIKKSVIESHHKVYDKANFCYVADAWLSAKAKTVSSVTHKGYSDCYDYYIKISKLKDLKVKDIEPIDVSNFMSTLMYKPATVTKVMSTLKQIFDFAITMNYIRYNPCSGIKKPNIKITKKTVWTPDEIKRFLSLKDVRSSSCYIALVILFSTGMRPGEVCGLRWRDYDGECFSAQNGIDTKRNETELKNDKAHDEVYISAELKKELAKHKNRMRPLYLENGIPFTVDAYINCLVPDMRPMTPDYIHKTFKKLVIRNKFTEIRLYDARHSFGTNMMKDNINTRMVADMMRHTTVSTTLDRYSHTDKEMYKDTIALYNKKLL